MTVDAFLGRLRLKALDAGKARDLDWMADCLAACVEGPALRWYEALDDDSQKDWKMLKAALIETFSVYPPPSQRSTSKTALVGDTGNHLPPTAAETPPTTSSAPLTGLMRRAGSMLNGK